MLRANSLPKTRGALGERRDVWAIRDAPMSRDGMMMRIDSVGGGNSVGDGGGGMLLEYEYDYSDRFGGCDPLLRPSAGYVIPSSSSSSSASAAAVEAAVMCFPNSANPMAPVLCCVYYCVLYM